MKKRIAKMAYRLFLRPFLKKKVNDSTCQWDDKMLKILNDIVKDW